MKLTVDRWDVKCREIKMDNSQKYQIWLNGIGIGEIVNKFDAVEKLRKVFDDIESLQAENKKLKRENDQMRHTQNVNALMLADDLMQAEKENEQLRQESERMRERNEYLLKQLTNVYALQTKPLLIPAEVYHNPADVAIMREAIEGLEIGISSNYYKQIVSDANEEIIRDILRKIKEAGE